MKKHKMALSITAIAVVAILAVGYSTLAASSDKRNASGTETAANQTITESDAKKAALDHAGLKETDVSFITASIDKDHGKINYDVEFYVGNKEYDYEIDAVTGKILAVDYDVEHDAVPMNKETNPIAQSSASAIPSTDQMITAADAKKVALDHAGFQEADVYDLEADLDFEHGKAEYEVSFHVGRTEYEYDIDAVTGSILYSDTDLDE